MMMFGFILMDSLHLMLVVTYEVPYHPGKLEAVSYLNGVEAGRAVLQTAGKAVKLKVEADRNELPADGESLTFVKIRLEDAAGNFNRRESAAVTIKVEGCAALQGFGSADPSCEGSYQSHTWNTYDGSVMCNSHRCIKKKGYRCGLWKSAI